MIGDAMSKLCGFISVSCKAGDPKASRQRIRTVKKLVGEMNCGYSSRQISYAHHCTTNAINIL